MDPPAHKRWLQSQMLTNWVSFSGTDKRRIKQEKKRVNQKLPHHVEYFHFVDDPYSHLTAQILETFSARYNIKLTCYLVSKPPGDNAPEFELLMNLARYDAYMIADKYGLSFEDRKEAPKQDVIDIAQSILAKAVCDLGVVDDGWIRDIPFPRQLLRIRVRDRGGLIRFGGINLRPK